MKGILLAGGTGSRLAPLTYATNKHLLPVYKKPMYYYPFENLLNAEINKIFIVTSGDYFNDFENQLKNDPNIKSKLEKKELDVDFGLQWRPKGIADALGLAERFAEKDNVAVILADNIYGDDNFLKEAVKNFKDGSHIFLKEIPYENLFEFNEKYRETRAKYGIAEIQDNKIIGIEEKPKEPKTNLVVTGAYIYDNQVFDIVKNLKPSGRGELEISDVNNEYIKMEKMSYSILKSWWMDAGDKKESLLYASLMQFEKEEGAGNLKQLAEKILKNFDSNK